MNTLESTITIIYHLWQTQYSTVKELSLYKAPITSLPLKKINTVKSELVLYKDHLGKYRITIGDVPGILFKKIQGLNWCQDI